MANKYHLVKSLQPMAASKLLLVIGATGAQGRAVIRALLESKEDDGTPSPYTIRALTRNRTSKQAQELSALGVECVEGLSCHLKVLTFDISGHRIL